LKSENTIPNIQVAEKIYFSMLPAAHCYGNQHMDHQNRLKVKFKDKGMAWQNVDM
jgi:hypothetical protein